MMHLTRQQPNPLLLEAHRELLIHQCFLLNQEKHIMRPFNILKASCVKIGILLTNTGTPDQPTHRAVRCFLREFLSDRRIVTLPRFLWLPILHGLVLRLRPYCSAKLYREIWTPQGSPMRVIMQNLKEILQIHLMESITLEKKSYQFEVAIGMNYGHPSIQEGLDHLQKQNINEIIILPLFPQYSNTTTASSFDRVMCALKKWPVLPHLSLIKHYAHHPNYIRALAVSIKTTWEKEGKGQHLLISFHGIPEKHIKKGDPYADECQKTASSLAKALHLSRDQWTLGYQSRFGYNAWLKPATHVLLSRLPKEGIRHLDVIAPGFAIDCLETLEEIALRGKKIFTHSGGEVLRYIPALNEHALHIALLKDIIFSKI